MPYATLSEMTSRYGDAELVEQTDLTGSGVVNPVTVDRVLADASALIDGYLASRYSLPLVVTPDLLVSLCCDLARCALYVDAAPDVVKARRDQAMTALRDIAAGRLRLNVGAGADSMPAPSGLAVVVQSGRKVFGGGLR
ncbi:MAG: DUF1320 domain-containing protein [Zoogloea sp.]|uniref:gp436 family protein n=1 Tax=Zoogloea sp. TaxID=49181 RepID=UPI002602FC47|nr:DUF1320 domain-containing protein [Zoogloea sp.]MDD2991117.1 DUF1320 domain-containing protein [Zoogloea sp.]